MLATLLPGLRNLRVALTTGALLVGSLYVLVGDLGFRVDELRPSARGLLDLSPWVPPVLLGLLCGFVGSLYVTALEGFVDWVHRRTVGLEPSDLDGRLRKWWLGKVRPLSPSAQARVKTEMARFCVTRRRARPPTSTEQDRFVHSVLAELLWLEGKLTGGPLETTYDQFRSEGEFRLATSLLVPLVTIATLYAVSASTLAAILALVVALLAAAKLADYGFYYFRKAHSFLAHHIADGVVLTPSMEALIREADQSEAEMLTINYTINDTSYMRKIGQKSATR